MYQSFVLPYTPMIQTGLNTNNKICKPKKILCKRQPNAEANRLHAKQDVSSIKTFLFFFFP